MERKLFRIFVNQIFIFDFRSEFRFSASLARCPCLGKSCCSMKKKEIDFKDVGINLSKAILSNSLMLLKNSHGIILF